MRGPGRPPTAETRAKAEHGDLACQHAARCTRTSKGKERDGTLLILRVIYN
jgi:hypothetical protein